MSHGVGADIIAAAKRCVGQKYVLGAIVPKSNPNWKGPWDCAEFVSWCAYQAYGLVVGMRPRRIDKGDAYSGFWFDDAKEPGASIAVADALKIPGAILVRQKRPNLIGHVSISLGDGEHTIEARGAKFGVNIFDGAAKRPWDVGMRLSGVDYDAKAVGGVVTEVKPSRKPLPPGYFGYRTPLQKGPPVVEIQLALEKKSIDPGGVDGEFGLMTEAAIGSFQTEAGIEMDGVVGPNTAKALGLDFPIVPSAKAQQIWAALVAGNSKPVEIKPDAPDPGTSDVLAIKRFIKQAGKNSVEFTDGRVRFIGSDVTYSDDMHRRGIWQDRDLAKIADVGLYDPADFVGSHQKWAYFLLPTITAESARYFGRINSYDRAAFTFGATQSAAHTPDENLILLFRALLKLPSAKTYFPDLTLSNGKVTLLKKAGGSVNLEEVVSVKRPNGKTESQLKRFMDYLNADPEAVSSDELTASARLLEWTKDDKAARIAQIDVFADRAKRLIASAKKKVPAFSGKDWRQAVWIVDITYQGRGTYDAIRAALGSSAPLDGLSRIGGSYEERRKTVKAAIAKLDAAGSLSGFTV